MWGWGECEMNCYYPKKNLFAIFYFFLRWNFNHISRFCIRLNLILRIWLYKQKMLVNYYYFLFLFFSTEKKKIKYLFVNGLDPITFHLQRTFVPNHKLPDDFPLLSPVPDVPVPGHAAPVSNQFSSAADANVNCHAAVRKPGTIVQSQQ